MIIELNVIFETYDKIIKFDVELYNLNFEIKVKEKKEIFKTFYARFSAAITFLNYFDILKISNLKRLINTKLKYRISGESFSTFRELITRLRHIIVDFEVIDKINSNKDKNNKIEGD